MTRATGDLPARQRGSGRRRVERPSSPATLTPESPTPTLSAGTRERDRLLLRVLEATGARIGEVLALCSRDVRRDALVLPNLKQPQASGRTVLLGDKYADLPGELLVWAHEQRLTEQEPLFFSRRQDGDGPRRAITRQQARQIITAAARRAREAGQDPSLPRAVGHRPSGPAVVEPRPRSQPGSAQLAAVDQPAPRNVGPPFVRERLVPRPRLVQALDGVLQHPVTLVAAPAGFGKTTILAIWEVQIRDRLAVAWVSLGPGDNDPVRFWYAILAALQTQQPALGATALARLRAGAPIALVVDDLLGDLAGVAEPIALVLDDYHVIATAEVHASLATLVNECPPAFRLLLSTRADPPLPLARLRSLGQLLELRAAQLSFSAEEAERLLDEALGIELSAGQVAALEARTEGWAAGLHLAALSLRAQADLPTALAAFAGSDRSVVDYFVEEVLDRLPEQARLFLERTSILERLSPALCDAVVGEPGSATVLEVLERSNVFLTPVDQGRQWFRYHQLFADALRHRLERNEPTLVPVLHERASAWFAGNELLDEAIEHALAGGCWERAADLLKRVFQPLMWRGEELTLRRWLQAIPEEVRQRHPVLAHATATTLLMTGETTRLAAFLEAAEPRLDRAGEHGTLGVLLSNHAQLAISRDDVDGALARAERALELLPRQPEPYRAQAFGAIVQGHLLCGDPAAAGQVYEQMRAAVTRDMRLVYWSHLVYGADRSRQLGDLPRAEAGYKAVLDETGERTVFARHQAWLGLSAIALEQNRLAEAADYLDRSHEAQRLSGRTYRTTQAAGLVQRARILRARGELGAADEALQQAEDAAREQDRPRVLLSVRGERAWLALLARRTADAERWADELDPAGLETYAREPEVLVLARIRRAQEASGEVAPLLKQLLADAEQVGRADSAIALLIQLALMAQQSGDAPGALGMLERAETLAEAADYVRVFLDEGEAIVGLLRQLLRSGVRPTYTARLLRAFGTVAEPSARTTELVTPRERDVLRLLMLGLPNRAIAERLVTSEATVKSHVHHLIDKLGVSSRAEVLVRARELGVLESVTRPGDAG